MSEWKVISKHGDVYDRLGGHYALLVFRHDQ